MLGGVIADFARNAEIAALPADVQTGVRLHRLIDGFTDRHPVVHKSIGRVSNRLGWFAGIVIDIYYDHLLARSWERYSTESLSSFATRAYHTLEKLAPVTPADASGFVRRFIDQDHINRYATIEGISQTLMRVSQRIAERIPKRAIWLPDALPDLVASDRELMADFESFYPELMAFAFETRKDERIQVNRLNSRND